MGLDFIGQLAEEDLTERVVDAGGMDAILKGMKTQMHDEEITRRSLDSLVSVWLCGCMVVWWYGGMVVWWYGCMSSFGSLVDTSRCL